MGTLLLMGCRNGSCYEVPHVQETHHLNRLLLNISIFMAEIETI